MLNKYDLCIVLRVYPGSPDKQKVFCDDKLTLYKKSLKSCIQGIGNLKCFIYILLDHCPVEYKTYIKDLLKDINHEIISYDKKQGNAQTFAKQVELLSNQNHSDLCLFLEDDYLHLPGSIEQFVTMMKNNSEVQFGTTYFSPDYQNMFIHSYRPHNLYYKDVVYGSFASTTMTFFVRKNILIRYKKELLSYTNGNHDFSMWFSMTKLGIYNVGNIILSLFTNFSQFKLFIYMWYKSFKYMIVSKKTNLYVPFISGSTHVDIAGLAPGKNWQKIRDSIII